MIGVIPKPIRPLARRFLERFVARYGYELKIKAEPLRGPQEFFSMASYKGFAPATVFDVGVGYSTQWLYDAFPKAYFVLVEANKDFEPALAEICKRYRGEFHIFAAGAKPSSGILQINENFPTSSGLVPLAQSLVCRLENNSVFRNLGSREVPVRPLDTLLDARLERPFLLKLDIEGYEIEALKGAEKILAETEMIITEISVQKRFQDELRFGDFISYLDTVGFDFFDVISLSQTSAHGPLSYMDAVFVNRKSRLLKI